MSAGADDLHEKTGLSTGAVADDNELSADLSHGGDFRRVVGKSKVDIKVGRWRQEGSRQLGVRVMKVVVSGRCRSCSVL